MNAETYDSWRVFGSLLPREDENRRLKKMYAEEKLKAEIVKEIIEKKL